MLASPFVRLGLASAFAIGIAAVFVELGAQSPAPPDAVRTKRPDPTKGPATSVAATCSTPRAWTEGAVVYGAVPPLFGPGGYRAITARLDALDALGVDALWLPPIHATDDESQISYAITDHLALRPDYGTRDELRALVAAAHARGIKVIIDFVPNHTSVGHPWFRDAERRGRSSKYYSYYRRDETGAHLYEFDWRHLPELDLSSPAVRAHVTGAFVHALRDLGVDGFRVDAAWAIRARDPSYWPELVGALEAVAPDVFLLAEAGARDRHYLESGFDAAYDWTDDVGRWAWEEAFADPSHTGLLLERAIDATRPALHTTARFLDNNDTGDRFITRHGVERTRVATVLLHTVPGIAMLFSGSEVGAELRPYEDPPPITWVDRHGLVPLHAELAALRASVPALRVGDWQPISLPDHPSALAFVRDAGECGRALVVLAFDGPVSLPLTTLRPDVTGAWYDHLSDRTVPLGTGSPLTMPARSALLLTPSEARADRRDELRREGITGDGDVAFDRDVEVVEHEIEPGERDEARLTVDGVDRRSAVEASARAQW
ncbi:alpha-amylase [Myxococcota bacterium]|nr:alpha-amylase [Myxococcota bacterium]